MPCEPVDDSFPAGLQSDLPPSPPPPSSPHRAQLQVWLTTRHLWPPPRSLCTCRVLGGRGWALENVVARICREADCRVTTNVSVRNLDLVGPGVETTLGSKWLLTGCLFSEVPNWRSTRQWSVHYMLMAPRAATHDGVATAEARRRKCRTCPELAGLHGRARLVVFGVEVGGRWSHETQNFLSQLAKAKARGETELMRRRAEQSWRLLRWGSFLSSLSLRRWLPQCWNCLALEAAMPAPQDVERDCRFSGLQGELVLCSLGQVQLHHCD